MSAVGIAHPRFETRAVARAYEALQADGATARIVGGAVRNAVLGRPITDIDFAVTTPPDVTIRNAEAAGFKTVPIGIAHGTVLLVDHASGERFEVTTLREDVETDGRRAVVRFGTDWLADAARRDFTMNALYRDPDGTLFDPLDGIADARARRVRFIGDPEARIREDGLRILRFFRFSAGYGEGRFDDAGLAACTTLAERLRDLSGERVQSELMRLLPAPHAAAAVAAMAASGVWRIVFEEAPRLDRFAYLVEAAPASEPVLRLASLLPDAECARRAAERLRLSGRDAEHLVGLASGVEALAAHGPGRPIERLYLWGAEIAQGAYLIAEAGARERDDWRAARQALAGRDRPVFPLKGRDALAAGIAAGPAIGRVLEAVEARWIAEGFPDRARAEALLAEAARDIA